MKITVEFSDLSQSDISRFFSGRVFAPPVVEAPPAPPVVEAPPAPSVEVVTPSVEASPPAPPAPPAVDVNACMRDVDANGMPWDKRIHARTRALTAGGVWRQKRGVDKKLVAVVEAELKTEPIEAVAPPPAPPVVEAVEAVAPPSTFPEFMRWVATKNKRYTETDGLNDLVSKVGLPSIGLLAVNLNYIPQLVEIVEAETH